VKKSMLLIMLLVFITGCDNETSEKNDNDTEPVHEIIGRYSDSFGGPHIISNTVWDQGGMMGRFNIEFFDSENDVIIAQNDKNNEFSAEKWSRFDYLIDSSKIYFCQIVYDLDTMQEAIDATGADRVDLDGGCNGFGWTELAEIAEESIDKDDALIVAWANGHESYIPGEDLIEDWKTPDKATGKAEGTSTDIVSLGNGGSIVLTFEKPITDGDGTDFAVFENSLSDTFLELAFVEVSSDGTNFLRFDTYYLGVDPVDAFGNHDPELIWGFAGKFKQGLGTQFDLKELETKPEVVDNTVDISSITHIRIVDVIGDGSEIDTLGNPIYDPYPTTESAGFDLDAVGVMNVVTD